jgi:hypothetical protein
MRMNAIVPVRCVTATGLAAELVDSATAAQTSRAMRGLDLGRRVETGA